MAGYRLGHPVGASGAYHCHFTSRDEEAAIQAGLATLCIGEAWA